MLTNASCTLYRFNKATGGYDRFFLCGVYWQQNKAGNVKKSGLQTADSTTVFLYDDACLPLTPTKDMLVKGKCPFAFTGITDKDISEQRKIFAKQHDFVVIKSVDNMMFGGLPHIEISAD